MRLGELDICKSSNINSFIRNYALAVEMTFTTCKTCKGTGLGGFSFHEQGGMWDGVSYCDDCDGTGFSDWKENELLALCDKCKGAGFLGHSKDHASTCKLCDGKGVVDWLEGIRRGILTGIPK